MKADKKRRAVKANKTLDATGGKSSKAGTKAAFEEKLFKRRKRFASVKKKMSLKK